LRGDTLQLPRWTDSAVAEIMRVHQPTGHSRSRRSIPFCEVWLVMPRTILIKPTHKPIQQYYQALKTYGEQHVKHEGALETAFQRLLADTAPPHG
jgi:hypothetical protein